MTASDNQSPNLVVGIGASAGGLAAFKSFLANTPADTGMAFVLVQHLAPDYKSLLVELLGAQSPIPVVAARDGLAVKENCVFVIPQDATLTIKDEILHLATPAPARELRRPIDTFFTSLAADCGERAVGIVLSGVGSDGTIGIKSIKEHGGLTLAQADSDTTALQGMPSSAVATGSVDDVLPAEAMAARLIDYYQHLTDVAKKKDGDGNRGDLQEHLAKITSILHARSAHDFSGYKQATLIRRLQRRMQVLHMDNAVDYLERLQPGAPDSTRLRAMVLNPEVIAVDQDTLGRQGEKVREDTPGQVVYSKMLTGNGRRAVLLLNENDTSVSSITVYWGDLGLASGAAKVRDLVSRADLGTSANSYTVSGVPLHGSRLLLVQGAEASASLGGWQTLSKKILGAPTVVKNGNVISAAALGLDRYYWVRGLTGSSIANWTRIKPSSCGSDVIFFADPTLLSANNAVSIFGTGYVDSPRAQTTDAIRAYQAYSYDNGGTWSCYGDLGKPSVGLFGRLAVASPDGSTVDLIGRGGDNALWYKRYTASSGWSGWNSAGACVRSGVSASARPNGVVDLVAIGCDNKVWHGWYTTPGNINWEALPGATTFSGPPSSVWNDTLGTYTVYATALFGHDIQSSTWNSTSGWSAWTSLGGCSKAGVAATGVSPTTLIGTACNTPGTNADSDPIGDTPVSLPN